MKRQLNLYLNRIATVHDKLKAGTAFLFEDPHDIFYLTGMRVSRGSVWIDKNGALLLVDSRYIDACQQACPIEARLESADLFKELRKGIKRIGVNGGQVTLRRAKELKLPTFDVKWMDELRIVKSREEIAALSHSADILWKAFQKTTKQLREGISEAELCAQFHINCLQIGVEGLSFEPIIAFGENSALPHHHPGERRLKRGDIVLIDIGVVVGGYCSDMTRTIFFGRPCKKLQEIERIVRKAYTAGKRACKEGVSAKSVDRAAREVIEKAGYGDRFIHSLGHGVGLQVHEAPWLTSKGNRGDTILKKGMVFTLEPGIYLPGIGGIRYENMLVLNNSSAKSLFPHDK
ncbi:MAG: aminopeptidase P family protein [Simkaniaceae bacterium]|nr:aminopeptidase P family protein [Simkaniaceae bacterium]